MTNSEIRSSIAQSIAQAVQKGCPPWRRPWGNSTMPMVQVSRGLPRNFHTGKKYAGINTLLLMMSCEAHSLQSPYWGSMHQWAAIGGYVRPRPHHVPEGTWGTSIIYYTECEKKKDGSENPAIPTEDGRTETYMVMRRYTVFNVDQVAPPDVELLLKASAKVQRDITKRVLGCQIPMSRELALQIRAAVAAKLAQYRCVSTDGAHPSSDFAAMERLLASTGAKFRYGGNRACYHPHPDDFIQLPHKKTFDSLAAFYETACHELVHWSESERRVGQCPKHQGGGSAAYAFGELVAEIGACYLAVETGLPIEQHMLPRSQSYIDYWLSQIGGDPKFIFEASTQAGKCVDFVLELGEKDMAARRMCVAAG